MLFLLVNYIHSSYFRIVSDHYRLSVSWFKSKWDFVWRWVGKGYL